MTASLLLLKGVYGSDVYGAGISVKEPINYLCVIHYVAHLRTLILRLALAVCNSTPFSAESLQ